MKLLSSKLKSIGCLRKVFYIFKNFQNRFSYKKGKNNKVYKKGQKVNSRIQITGNNNKVVIEDGSLILNSLIKISGNNNIVVLSAKSYISGAELWIEDNQCELKIGKRTFIGHHSHIACTEDKSKLIIGDDCMISSYVQIRTGDSHSIIDMEGNRINKAASVFIGDKCWIGEGSKILKGVTLDGNVIVSTGAIVTKSFSTDILIGGIPAKPLKYNVSWRKERI